MAKIKTNEKIETNVPEALKKLLKTKMPGCFEREPNPAYNSNLDKLVLEILTLV